MLSARHLASASFAPLRHVAARRALATAAAAQKIVFTSPHARIDIPDKTIWDIAQERAATDGDRNAFICGLKHKKLSFAELHESAGRLALALAQDGVRKGDVSCHCCYCTHACGGILGADSRRCCLSSCRRCWCTRSTASSTRSWCWVRCHEHCVSWYRCDQLSNGREYVTVVYSADCAWSGLLALVPDVPR